MQGAEQASGNLVDLAKQATSAVPQTEAADVWSTAFKALAAQHLPLEGLLGSFIRALSSSAAGPVRVRTAIFSDVDLTEMHCVLPITSTAVLLVPTHNMLYRQWQVSSLQVGLQ